MRFMCRYYVRFLSTLFLIFLSVNVIAQVSGDYQSNVNPTGNWNAVGSWQTYNGSAWVAATNYPGEVVGAGTVTIRDGDNITLSNSPPNAIGALVIGEGASGIFSTNNGDRTLNVTNGLTVKAGASFNLRRMTLSIGTNTQIDGALTDNNDNGSATFTGTFTIGSAGSISTTNASAFTFIGAITNDGTFSLTGGGTIIIRSGITNNSSFNLAAVTFNTNNNQSIAGSSTITISGITTITGITVINNNADVNLTSTSNNSITGTGTWEQGATGVLKFSGGSMNITTVDFDASGNTVNYTRGGNQTIRLATYHHLTVSTSGTKTLGGAITVNGNLDVTSTSTTTLACDVYQITGNASGTCTMASGTTMTLGNTGNATNVLFPSGFTNGNTTLNSASTVTYQNNSTQTVSSAPTYGNLTIATGSTKTLNGNATIGGNLTISAGTFDLGTTATTVSITGTATVTGTLTFSGTTTKTVSITGDLSGAGTINMSGGNLLHNLNLGGANNAITTFTTSVGFASTVTYTRSGNQQVFGSTNYRNLATSGSGTKSMQAAVTVNNTFTIGNGTSFDPVGNSITVSGSSFFAGTLAESNTGGTNAFQDVDLSGGTINGTVTDVTNINGNLTISTGNGTIGRTRLTVSGTTTIADGRTLNINSDTGVKTFVGMITVNGSGSWTSTTVVTTGNLVMRGGIDVPSSSGSFSAGEATFNTNGQYITGAGAISFNSAVTITGAITIENTNTQGVTFNNTVSGSVAGSTWKNGMNGVTYYQPAAVTQPMNTGALDVSSTGNQFHYSSAGNQNVKLPATSYYHLYISGGSSGVKTVQGATGTSGDLYIATSTSLEPAGQNLTVSGTSTIAGTLLDNNVTGTTSLLHVDLSGGTIDGSATGIVNITGNLTMPTANGTIGRMTLTVTGTTTVATGRTLTFNANSNTGVKRFNSGITINGTGTWTSTNISTGTNLDLRGGIDVVSSSGSFAGGAATFNATQSVTGAGAITFANAVTVTGAITVTNTNTNGITFNNTIDGTLAGSTWANGANGVTYYQPAVATQPMNTGAISASANGNYFYYSRAGAQNVKAPATSYYHLYISGGSSSVKTLQGSTSVSGDLNIAASTSLEPAAQNLTVSGTTTIAGTLVDNSTTGTASLQGVDLSGGTIDGSATGSVNINGNLTMSTGNGTIGRMTLTVSGTTTVETGRSLTFNVNSNTGVKRFNSGITINGTGTWTSTNISTGTNLDLRGGIDVTSASGSFTAGAATFNASQSVTGAGSITFANAVSVAGAITVANTNISGVTFNNTIDGTVAGSTWANGASGIVNYQPAATTQPMNTGALDASGAGNTFNYSRTGAQTIKVPSTAYHNLSLSGGAVTKTLAGAITINGNLSIGSNVTLDVDAAQSYSLTVKGNFVNSGTYQPRTGTVTFNGTSDQAITSNGSSFYTVVFDNSATQVSLNDNLTISNILTLTDGVITTGAPYRVVVSSSSSSAISGYSSASFINGNLRRNFTSNTNTYVFPIGNGTSSSYYYQADIINNNLTGITYIDSRFKSLTGHNDAEMNVSDYWEHGSLAFSSINTAGVWELEPNAQPSGGGYGIRLFIANMPGLVENDFGPLKRPVGSTSGADWSTGGGRLNPNDLDGRTIASGYMKRIGLTSFSEFGAGMGSGSGGGLPIELLSFTAEAEEAIVKLEWVTATEINNDFFTVERSQDGLAFEELHVFEGAGNSSQTLSYHTYDRHPLEGVSYYRLKQTDYDGAFTYSDIVSVSIVIEKPQLVFTVFPNPVSNGKFFVQIENNTSDDTPLFIDIIDASGRIVFSKTLQTQGAEQLPVNLPENINAGIYFVLLRAGQETSRHAIVVN